MTADDLQAFANSRQRGYLKSWKAQSMLMTLRDMPMRTRGDLRKWVANCLEMEGFDAPGIDAVTDALAHHKDLEG